MPTTPEAASRRSCTKLADSPYAYMAGICPGHVYATSTDADAIQFGTQACTFHPRW